jgi:hypothetical protein
VFLDGVWEANFDFGPNALLDERFGNSLEQAEEGVSAFAPLSVRCCSAFSM